MSNSLDFVSLRRNCSSRFVKSNGPTPSEGTFLLKDFISPNFIDQVFNSYQQTTSDDKSHSQLGTIIQDIQDIFESYKNEIERIKHSLISKAWELFGSDRNSIKKEKLRGELKELHEKVVQNNFEPGILEEFVVMFNHAKEKMLTPPKPVSPSAVTAFKSFVEEVQADTKRSIQECSAKAKKEIVLIPEVVPEKTLPATKPYKTQELFQVNSRDIQGCYLELEGKSAILCFGYDKKVGIPLKAKLYAIEKGKLCYSIPNSDRLPHAYSKKLNCLAFCHAKTLEDGSKDLIVDLHRITSRGVKKITEMPIRLPANSHVTFEGSPLLNNRQFMKASDVKLTFIDRFGLLLVKQGKHIFVVNMFTKKLLCQKEYTDGILDVNYVKDFNSVVVLTCKEIILYKIQSKDYSLLQFYSIKTPEDDSYSYTAGRLFVEGNIILTSLNQTYRTEPHSSCHVLEILESRVKHSTFLVLSALNYVPVINAVEGKITLFGVLPWLGLSLRKNYVYFITENYLKEEVRSPDHQDQKEIIYADNFRTIIQKKLNSGDKQILYGTREVLVEQEE